MFGKPSVAAWPLCARRNVASKPNRHSIPTTCLIMSQYKVIVQLFALAVLIETGSDLFAQTTTRQVAAGSNHSLVLTESGELFGFGRNDFGALGLGDSNRVDIPRLASHPNLAGKTIIDMSLGGNGNYAVTFILLLTSDGQVFSFGNNSSGEAGHTVSEPTRITAGGLDTVFVYDIAAEEDASLLATNKGIYVFGANPNGYMGTGNNINPIPGITRLSQSNVNLVPFKKIVSTRNGATYAIAENDSLFVFGRNSNGELGLGTFLNQLNPTLLSKSHFGGRKIVKFSAEGSRVIALTEDGLAYFWGYREGFEGTSELSGDLVTPQLINHVSLSGKVIVDVGLSNELNGFLVASDGTVFGFGPNKFGELGLGDKIARSVPTALNPSVFQGKTITRVFPSTQTTYFLASDGTIFSTGFGGDAALGLGFSGFMLTPHPMNADHFDNKSISNIAAYGSHLYLIASDGTLYSTIDSYYFIPMNSFNQRFLRGFPIYDRPRKVDLTNLGGDPIYKIRAGLHKSFILTTNGNVYGMGRASTGELGTTDSMDVFVPTLLDQTHIVGKKIVDVATSGNPFNTLSSQRSHSLILADDGTLFGFGENSNGQLGLGDNSNRRIATPITANLNGKTIIHIAAGSTNSMAIADDGSVFLWGKGGLGEMGFGNTDDLIVPTLATHLTSLGKTFVKGAIGDQAGRPYFILLASDGAVYGFGQNLDGQLGINNGKVNQYTPTQLTDASIAGKRVVDVVANTNATTMIRTEIGEVYAFGRATHAGFAVSLIVDYVVPTRVNSEHVANRNVVGMSLFDTHSMLLLEDGRVLTAVSSEGALGSKSGVLGNSTNPSELRLHFPVLDFTTYASPIPTTDLALHLDASRLGFIAANDSVSTWLNLADNTKNGVHPGLTLRPTRADSSINNRPALRFNGTSSYFTLPTAADLGIQNNDYEVFIVAKSATTTTAPMFLLGGSNNEFELKMNIGVGLRFNPRNGIWEDRAGDGAFTDGTAHLFNAWANSSEIQVNVNRAGSTQSIHGHSGYAGNLNLGIGLGYSPQYHFAGDIAEVIIYNRVLSAQERAQVDVHLFAKYGIQNYKNEAAQLTGSEGWRLLSSPVADSSFASFFRGFWTQGFAGASVSHGAPTVYTWPITTANRDSTQWTALSNAANTFAPGQGILAYVFSDDDGPGNASNAGFPKTLRADGFSPSADVNLNSLINPNTNGWSLVGNPFTTNIDWDLMSKTNLSNSVYVWDHSDSEWKSWNGSVGGLSNGLIGPFNGFFVETMAASPALSVPTSAKVEGTSVFLGKEDAAQTPSIELALRHESGVTNAAWVEFSEHGLPGKDALDALKLVPLSADYVQLASADADGRLLDINQWAISDAEVDIPLHVRSTYSGAHVLGIQSLALPDGWDVRLMDTHTGESVGLDGAIHFDHRSAAGKALADPTRQPEIHVQEASEARFVLRVSPSGDFSDESLPTHTALMQNFPNPFNPSTVIRYMLDAERPTQLTVYDVLGREVAVLVDSVMPAGVHQVTFDATRLASGMYIYRLQAGNVVMTRKLTLIK